MALSKPRTHNLQNLVINKSKLPLANPKRWKSQPNAQGHYKRGPASERSIKSQCAFGGLKNTRLPLF